MMSNLFNFRSVKISEKAIEELGVPRLRYEDIKLDKTPIATTGSGIFYKGTFKKAPCSIKVIDITRTDKIKNEFILWNEYKENENFLRLLGFCIKSNNAYLVFEFFAFTLEFALNQNLITEDNRADLVKQCLYILSVLQGDQKLTADIRPGVFGITDQVCVKLLDFGICVSDPVLNNDLIVEERMKYQPPEYFKYNGEDLNYDLWSTGCLILDMYSTEETIFNKKDMTQEKLVEEIFKTNSYPPLPNDLSPLLKSILKRCFEKDFNKRLKIDELIDNMRIFFDIDNYENLNHNEVHKFSFDFENKLEEFYQFSKNINNNMSFTSMMINTNYFIDIENMINSIESYKMNMLRMLDSNLSKIKNSINILYEMNKKLILLFHEKTLSKLLIMKEYFGLTLNEITRTKKISDEVKRGINSLSKFKNLEEYKNIVETYEDSVTRIKDIVKQFSDKQPFDKVSDLYNNTCDIVESFNNIMINNRSLSLQVFIDLFFDNSYGFLSDNNVVWLGGQLGLTYDVIEEYSIRPPPQPQPQQVVDSDNNDINSNNNINENNNINTINTNINTNK